MRRLARHGRRLAEVKELLAHGCHATAKNVVEQLLGETL
jgi:hypothetical protein